jgi:hypothetical protein
MPDFQVSDYITLLEYPGSMGYIFAKNVQFEDAHGTKRNDGYRIVIAYPHIRGTKTNCVGAEKLAYLPEPMAQLLTILNLLKKDWRTQDLASKVQAGE